ncbi:PP2C family protein-serine/threonine phosphatase [Candidatus Soleaferrea massiliensis]|uniref:PP2C family protein-serine/threonine phosphatase n=1 Tax=Candidatus Soleaferrea massiliensis TaxID=1470354 RepID=UPI00058C016E|nr:protein phosphatase 2C domain-containing protein [Candidatus Soleaferrea massiliensis]
MNYLISASTDIGIVKSSNQDSLSAKVISTNAGKLAFAVLCDGMGGLQKGEVASSSVVHAFMKWSGPRLQELCRAGLTDEDVRADWESIIRECSEKIRAYGIRSGIRLGTTVTAMLLSPDRCRIIHVGDTRAYEIKESIRLLTRDQTVVAHEVACGTLTEEQAETDARRNVLLQCVGASDAVFPDWFSGGSCGDAVYMLCSDGFRHKISAQEIHAAFSPENMTDTQTMREKERSLIELNKQRQERDNISVVTIRTY